MATVPRYVGATVAEAVANIRAGLGLPFFLQYFDWDRDGAVGSGSDEETALVRGICDAELEIDEALGAGGGAPFVATVERPIPDSVRSIAIQRTPWCVIRFRPFAEATKTSARREYDDSTKRLDRIRTDNGRRLAGPAVVPAVSAEASASGGYVEPEVPTAFPDPRDPRRFIAF